MAKKKPVSSIDVLSHNLVPEMKILEENQKKQVLKQYDVTSDQLPKILLNDPSVQALKAEAGDIISIEREDLTGKYKVYKLVVESAPK